MAEFPAGQEAMNKYIADNIKYPAGASEKMLPGTVYLTMIIEKDGSVSNVNVLRGIKDSPAFSEESKRVVSSMPKWSPGQQNGKNVRIKYNLPISFMPSVIQKDTATSASSELIYAVVEQACEFPGGTDKMQRYIEKTMKYPSTARTENRTGTPCVTFVVEEDGRITDIKILRSSGSTDLDEEAMRIVKSMPKWIPGKQNGKGVRVQFNLPIRIMSNN